eukprot:356221-Chlamydomonas_euryale.AAC.2
MWHPWKTRNRPYRPDEHKDGLAFRRGLTIRWARVACEAKNRGKALPGQSTGRAQAEHRQSTGRAQAEHRQRTARAQTGQSTAERFGALH